MGLNILRANWCRHINLIFKIQKNYTRSDSSVSGISDEEVDYGSFDSSAYPATDSDRAWSPSID